MGPACRRERRLARQGKMDGRATSGSPGPRSGGVPPEDIRRVRERDSWVIERVAGSVALLGIRCTGPPLAQGGALVCRARSRGSAGAPCHGGNRCRGAGLLAGLQVPAGEPFGAAASCALRSPAGCCGRRFGPRWTRRGWRVLASVVSAAARRRSFSGLGPLRECSRLVSRQRRLDQLLGARCSATPPRRAQPRWTCVAARDRQQRWFAPPLGLASFRAWWR